MSNLTQPHSGMHEPHLVGSALSTGGQRILNGLQLWPTAHRWLLVWADSVITVSACAAAVILWLPTTYVSPLWHVWLLAWFCIATATWWACAALNDLYRPAALQRYSTIAIRTFVAGVLYLGVMRLITWLLAPSASSAVLIALAAVQTGGVLLERMLYMAVTKKLTMRRRALIVGSGEQAQMISKVMSDAPGVGYHVLGYYDDASLYCDGHIAGLPVWQRGTSLYRTAAELNSDELVVAVDKYIDHDLFAMLMECKAHGMRVTWMNDLYSNVYSKLPLEYLDPTSALHAIQKPHGLIGRAAKRMLDLVLVLLNLPLLAVLLPVISVAIKLDSPGPIFYRQVRTGRAGEPFHILKFRTMVVNAEQAGKPQWASKDDSRITRTGRLLRKTRLDELPQVLNILSGNMSFIGPRPERPEFIAQLEKQVPFYRTRLLLKPGLTGWAQVNYEYGNSVNDALVKLQYDLYYVRHWSLWLDIYILFRTISVIFLCKGM